MLRAVQQGVTGETKPEGGRDCSLGNHSVQLDQEETGCSREKRSNQSIARGVTGGTGHFRREKWPALSDAVDITDGERGQVPGLEN